METRMKKILGGLTAGALVLGLAACLLPAGNGNGLYEDGTVIPPTPPAPPDTNLTLVWQKVVATSGCLGCHSGSAPFGNLKLSTVADMRAALFTIGIDTVPKLTNRLPDVQPRWRVLPNEPDSSLLYQIVSTDDPKGDYPRMPKDADPLAASKIALIRRWIELGASLK